MAKFVIAGRADCPYYAKTELLADYLQKNLPDFRIHKITQRPEVWEDWLKDVCEKNKWSHKNSPIIWRELLDRGGKGLLLGGYNEFLEHAQLYYDVTSSMTTELMMVIAQENLGAHIQKEQEEEGLKTCINPLQVWITRLYGYLIEKNAHESVRVIVGGKTFVNLKTVLLMRYAPRIAHNIIAVALGVEGEAKAILARKLKTTPSYIKDVIIWGNISGNNYVDLRKTRVYRYESAIWGPLHYSRPLLNLIFDSEWIKREFVATLKNLTATGRQFGGILAAHSIATTLKYWYHGSPPGEIVSLGILSEGQFGIPKGIVFSMPVKFENGTWVVLTDLKDTEISEQIMTRMTSDLIQEKLVALGDKIHFQPYQSETELRKKDKRISLPITDDSQKEQVSDEHKDLVPHEEKNPVMSDAAYFLNQIPQTTFEKPQSLEFLNGFEGKTVES
uniref:putative malate dehydrogenase 1B isoform X8 n=1 Tax=Macaca mulatta TaxID=9544 RepID=UPI0010A2782A|nr:putative malate dehydrogenase 1B isoform X8 [Macaca mulatta]